MILIVYRDLLLTLADEVINLGNELIQCLCNNLFIDLTLISLALVVVVFNMKPPVHITLII